MATLQLKLNLVARFGFAAMVLLAACTAFSTWTLPLVRMIPWREAAHFCAFFALTCAAAFSFPKVRLARIALISGGAGALSELIQATPWVGRHCTLSDWMADLAGVVAVMAVSLMISFRQAQTPQRRGRPAPRRSEEPPRYDRLARAGRVAGR